MAGPSWLAGLLAAAMILTAGYAASRLAAARVLRAPAEADTDALHALMGTAMAGMFLPQLRLLPSSAWAVVFGAAGTWFAAAPSALAGPRRAAGNAGSPFRTWWNAWPCCTCCWPCGPGRARQEWLCPGWPAPAAAAGFPALALVLALFMLGYLLWITDRLATRARASSSPGRHAPDPAPAPGHRPGRTVRPRRQPGQPHRHARRRRGAAPRPPSGHRLLAARYAECSKIVMSIAMGYMLITML